MAKSEEEIQNDYKVVNMKMSERLDKAGLSGAASMLSALPYMGIDLDFSDIKNEYPEAFERYIHNKQQEAEKYMKELPQENQIVCNILGRSIANIIKRS